jgi:hypothetical protein
MDYAALDNMDCAALDNTNQVVKRKCATIVSKQNMDCAALDNIRTSNYIKYFVLNLTKAINILL